LKQHRAIISWTALCVFQVFGVGLSPSPGYDCPSVYRALNPKDKNQDAD